MALDKHGNYMSAAEYDRREAANECTPAHDGDGAAGVAFYAPCDRVVFVSRKTDRGEPRQTDAGDWELAEKLHGFLIPVWVTDREPSESGFYWVVEKHSKAVEPWQFDRDGHGAGCWYTIGDEVSRSHSVLAWCGPIVPPVMP